MAQVIEYPKVKIVRTPDDVRELEERKALIEERKSRSVWMAWYANAFQNRMAAQWQDMMNCEAGRVSMKAAEEIMLGAMAVGFVMWGLLAFPFVEMIGLLGG